MGRQLNAKESVLDLTRRREYAEADVAKADAGTDRNARVDADNKLAQITQTLAEANERSTSAAKDRLAVESAIATTRIRAADESIQRTQDEIAMRKSAIEQERDALRTSKERFGLLDEGQQKQIISLKKRFDAGQDIGIAGMKRLGQIGTIDEQEALGRYAIKRADEAGFDPAFAQEEEGRIRQQQKEMGALEVNVANQREYRLKVETNADKVAERLLPQVEQVMRDHDEQVDEKVAAGLSTIRTELTILKSEMADHAVRNAATFKL